MAANILAFHNTGYAMHNSKFALHVYGCIELSDAWFY